MGFFAKLKEKREKKRLLKKKMESMTEDELQALEGPFFMSIPVSDWWFAGIISSPLFIIGAVMIFYSA